MIKARQPYDTLGAQRTTSPCSARRGAARRLPHQLCGGMAQRVAVAAARTGGAPLLFADEPTSRLDPITQRDTLEVLRDVSAERGLAVLLVTHEAAMAGKLAGRRIALEARDPHPVN